MPCDLETIQEEACASGLGKLQNAVPLLQAIAQLLCEIVDGGGGGGGANGQVMEYTAADPTTQGLTPTDPTKPAVAYKRDGSSSTYVWNTALGIWN